MLQKDNLKLLIFFNPKFYCIFLIVLLHPLASSCNILNFYSNLLNNELFIIQYFIRYKLNLFSE